MVGDTQTLYVRNTRLAKWIIRFKFPETSGQHQILVMLHGWTGDENSMWVFAKNFPENFLILAPRGIYRAPNGGYGWHQHTADMWPTVDDFFPAVDALKELLTAEYFPIRYVGLSALDNISMIGFSQGAAFMYIFSLLNSSKIRKFAGLSGFLPGNIEKIDQKHTFDGTPVFIAHGSSDRVVLVENARKTVDYLGKRGAKVTYCEEDVGHRLSRKCYKGLEEFYLLD